MRIPWGIPSTASDILRTMEEVEEIIYFYIPILQMRHLRTREQSYLPESPNSSIAELLAPSQCTHPLHHTTSHGLAQMVPFSSGVGTLRWGANTCTPHPAVAEFTGAPDDREGA